jgi:hypothetical protein
VALPNFVLTANYKRLKKSFDHFKETKISPENFSAEMEFHKIDTWNPDLSFEAAELESEASAETRLARVMSQNTTRGNFSSRDLTM